MRQADEEKIGFYRHPETGSYAHHEKDLYGFDYMTSLVHDHMAQLWYVSYSRVPSGESWLALGRKVEGDRVPKSLKEKLKAGARKLRPNAPCILIEEALAESN